MNDLEKLELINTMEFIDADADGEVCYAVYVADNKINRNILLKIGFDDEYLDNEELDAIGDEDEDKLINVAPIAFKYSN